MQPQLYINALLENEGLKINKAIYPQMQLDDSRSPVAGTDRLKILRFMNKVRFDLLVLGDNFKCNTGIINAPTGYYGRLHPETVFQADPIDRQIFRGIAIYNLKNRSVPFTESELAAYRTLINLHLRDSMLGIFSWAGIYERTSCESDYLYCLVVVCGLSDDEYDELFSICCAKYANVESVQTVLNQLLPHYRELARKRRRLIMGILYRLLGFETPGTEVVTSTPGVSGVQVSDKVYSEMKQCMGGIIFRWSKFPSRIPLGTTEVLNNCKYLGTDIGSIAASRADPELIHTSDYIILTMDVTLDDYVQKSPTECLRLSGHVVASDEQVKPFLLGPGDPINLYTDNLLLGSIYACQMPAKSFSKQPLDLVFTDDPEEQQCRILCGDYSAPRPKPTEQLRPKLVRCGMRDDIGLVRVNVTDDVLSLFCLEDYEAIA